jgi:hypothetical protein
MPQVQRAAVPGRVCWGVVDWEWETGGGGRGVEVEQLVSCLEGALHN